MLLYWNANAQFNTDRILINGRNALYFEDFVLAIQYFNQVIRVRPFLAEPYLYRGIAKIQLGDYEGGQADLTLAIERNPFIPEAYYARGFTKMKLHQYIEAEKDFDRAIEFSPRSEHLFLSRMNARERNGDLPGALTDLKTYIRLNPKSTELLYDKGRLLLAMKDTVQAELAFNQLIESDSTLPLGWSARALLHLQRKKLDEAYRDYTKAIQRNSTFAGDFINRGIINVEARRFMEALSDYDRAIALDPNSTLALQNRGMLRSNLGDDNNALNDFIQVLEIDSTIMEARYGKALLELRLRNYRTAIADFRKVINQHPFFLPAYWGIADAFAGMNNSREAFRYRQMASDMERNKDSLREKMQQDLAANNKIDEERPQGTSRRHTNVFNRFATNQTNDQNYQSVNEQNTRGNVQQRRVDVVTERNFTLTYYSRSQPLRRTNLYHLELDLFNRRNVLKGELKLTNTQIPLTNDLIVIHFENIELITQRIKNKEQSADLYFQRAIDYTLVKDYHNALEDLNSTISLRPNFMLAYFMRANVRFMQLEYLRNSLQNSGTPLNTSVLPAPNIVLEHESVLRDLDRVIELQPDFSFAYYNKANILASQQQFDSAIAQYTKAIEADPEFAEAFLNRGLTYLFVGEDNKGMSDLSKAGELGLYAAYSLMQQFK